MKHLLAFLALACLSITSFCQVGETFKEADSLGINLKHLDSIYMSGVHIDSTKAAFAGHEEEFINAYNKMLEGLGLFLNNNNFTWGKTTRCFNRIYFKADGTIDYFLYNFKQGEIEAGKEIEFKRLLNEYIKTYKFPLKSKVNFAQCSPVIYMDK